MSVVMTAAETIREFVTKATFVKHSHFPDDNSWPCGWCDKDNLTKGSLAALQDAEIEMTDDAFVCFQKVVAAAMGLSENGK